MKTYRCALAFALCSAPSGAPLQAAFTSPVGYVTFSLPATAADTTTYHSVPVALPSEYSGVVTSNAATTITVTGPVWTDTQWTQTPYHVRMLSGQEAGRTLAILAGSNGSTIAVDVTDGSADSIALDTPNFALAAGDTFAIIPNWTLGNFFGTETDSLALTGGADDGSADRVGLWDRRTGAFNYYYFNASVSRWVQSGDATLADCTNTPIEPNGAVAIVRPSGRAALDLYAGGSVPTVAALIKLPAPGAVSYAGTGLPVSVALPALQLSDWKRNDDPAKADVLSFYKSAHGRWIDCFQNKASGWLRVSSGKDESEKVIAAGSVISIRKDKSQTGAKSFLQIALPYVLND